MAICQAAHLKTKEILPACILALSRKAQRPLWKTGWCAELQADVASLAWGSMERCLQQEDQSQAALQMLLLWGVLWVPPGGLGGRRSRLPLQALACILESRFT